LTTPNPPTVTIPLALGEIYAALCPDCQKAVVDLVSAKAGPELLRQAIAAQFAHPGRAAAVGPPPAHGEPVEP
jgi:hypothetical protein